MNWDGSVPAYTEQCAAIMAVTYGQDMFTNGKDKAPMVRHLSILSSKHIQWLSIHVLHHLTSDPQITTEGDGKCTEDFSGTSATTAMASGIIALALEAK